MFQIGQIVSTHGLKGEVKVKIETDFSERFDVGKKVHLKDENTWIELLIIQSRRHKGMQIIKFKGYHSIHEVEKWINKQLFIQASQQHKLPKDEFYYHEIIDCLVYTLDDDYVGKITNILKPGANDVWVIKTETNKEVLIPYIDDVIKSIDISSKIIKIKPMEGLLDL